MIIQDIILITKKIIVGIVVLLVPFFIFFGALWAILHFL
jgi:hypothetical protein